MPTAEIPLPGEPRSASAARRFLAETLASWKCTVDVAAGLLLTELVTNAVLHAKTEIVVRIVRLVDGLRLEVADRSPTIPLQRHYSLDATTGRGLALVAALARSWGTRPEHGGKVVWCEVSEHAEPTLHVVSDPDVEVDLDAFPEPDDAPAGDGRGSTLTRVGTRPAALTDPRFAA